jgi:hypothetical protein
MIQPVRRGMWIRRAHDGAVGILQRGQSASMWSIHVVGEDGSTVAVAPISVLHFRQARLSEIPAVRRPSAEMARQFGYR